MKNLSYDNPNDIESVELIIQAASGISSPVIYANGRNQLAVQIIAKATRKNDDDEDVVLNFAHGTWAHILNLRHAESDQKLTWKGSSGWCFTDKENDYTREVTVSALEEQPIIPLADVAESGSTLFLMYVHTDEISTKRIAVSIDTDNGKHFTTADNASGAEKSSVAVRAIQPFIYSKNDITIDIVKKKGESTAKLEYSSFFDKIVTEEFDCYYDNIYISSNKAQFKNCDVHSYGGGGEYPLRVAQNWAVNNDQHMLIANPPAYPKGEATLGYHGTTSYSLTSSPLDYHLFQNFVYNDRPNSICWTHFFFATSKKWYVMPTKTLDVNGGNFSWINFDSWFDFYDVYGNYGQFNIKYDSSSKEIEITSR